MKKGIYVFLMVLFLTINVFGQNVNDLQYTVDAGVETW